MAKQMSEQGTILVTGASGFLGLHLVDVLLADGHTIRSLGRSHSAALEARGVEQRLGSVTDADACLDAVKGIDAIYHLAGAVSRDKDDGGRLYRVHIDGTRNMMDAALAEGISRILVLSTSGTVGVSEDADFVADEDSPVQHHLIKRWPYYESKAYVEKDVARYVAKGLPVKMARPTLLLGPGDHTGSSTGDVVKFLCGDVKASLPGGMSGVDVRDVAAVLPAILEKGEPGVGYLLGAMNLSVHEFLLTLGDLSGVTPPAMMIPHGLINKAEGLLKKISSWRSFGGLAPQTFEMGYHYWSIDSTRATEELGFSPRPFRDTLRETIDDLQGCQR